MRVTCTRDSVAMGDDADAPHEITPITSAEHVHLEYLLADDLDRMTAFARADPTRSDLRSLARYSDDR